MIIFIREVEVIMTYIFKFLLHLTLVILFVTVSIVAQAKNNDFENKEQNKLQKEIKIIRLMIKTSTWRDAPYNIQDLIWNKLTAVGFKVVSDASKEVGYDATMTVEYKESKGSEYGWSSGGPAFAFFGGVGGAGYGTHIECFIRLDHKDLGLVFKKTINVSTSSYVKGLGLYEDAIKNLKGEPYIKYLGNFIKGKLGMIEPFISILRESNYLIQEIEVPIYRSIEIDPKILKKEMIVLDLIGNLNDDNADVIIDTLAKINDNRAIEALIVILENNTLSAGNRAVATEALGKIMNKKAIDPLILALNDESWYVRKVATEALEKIGDTKAVEPLIAVLKDKDERVRSAAAIALGNIRDARVVVPLIEAL